MQIRVKDCLDCPLRARGIGRGEEVQGAAHHPVLGEVPGLAYTGLPTKVHVRCPQGVSPPSLEEP